MLKLASIFINSFELETSLVHIPDNTEMDATYRQTTNISCTIVGNKIVDHSEVVGVSPVGGAPDTST